MKTKLLFLFVILFSLQSNAQLQQQNVADNSGFTTLYSLSTGLSAGYFGSNIQSQLAFNNHYNGGSNMYTFSAIAGGIENPSLDYGGKLYLRTANNIGTLVTALTIDKIQNSIFSGNVGIGTTSPTAKLEVNGNLQLTNDGNSIQFKNDAVQISRVIYQDAMKLDSYGGFQFYDSSSGSERFRILAGGNVGIGTTNPDEKLTVNGNIQAKEVRVDLVGWPDYVFQKYYTGKSELKSDYIIPTLAEIESFTKKNHHLPDVPSAQNIKQNGLFLGEMSNVLLQKVEELTLYAIEQQKKLEEQNKTIKMQSKILETLTKRLNGLEKK